MDEQNQPLYWRDPERIVEDHIWVPMDFTFQHLYPEEIRIEAPPVYGIDPAGTHVHGIDLTATLTRYLTEDINNDILNTLRKLGKKNILENFKIGK